MALDHAMLLPADVSWDRVAGTVTLRLRRSRKKARPGWHVWWRGRYETVPSVLVIRNVRHCDFETTETVKTANAEVITGPLLIRDHELYLGSWCGVENEYAIRVTVDALLVELEDQVEQSKA